MLAADPDNLTAHDIASEATWADRYRDSDRHGGRQHYAQTRDWHFVNVELQDPTSIRPALITRRYQPARLPRMARRRLAWSIRSVNSPPNSPTPAPIPKNDSSH